MPINSTHPEYQRHIDDVTKTKDAFEGCVKDYVPRLVGQSNLQYEVYRSRAAYYNVVQRTVMALLGALTRKPYTLEGVVGDEPLCDDSCDFAEFIQQAYVELMVGGRIGFLCDYNADMDSPYLVSYRAEDITNWGENFVVLREMYYGQDAKDPYVTVEMCRYRELFLDENGVYTVRIWEQQGNRGKAYKLVDTVQPTYRGRSLEFIPFIFCTPYDTSKSVFKPMLSNLADINLEHFRVATDIAHGAHYLALPTPYIAGTLANDAQVVHLGSDQFIQLQQGGAVGFLEFQGTGMKFLLDLQKLKEEHMFNLGSRLLQYKAGVESSEALQLRLGAEGASLVTIANSLEVALTEILEIYNIWSGYPELEVELSLNKDFTPAKMAADDIRVLLELFQQGAITLETMMQRLYEGEVVDNAEEEIEGLTGQEEPGELPESADDTMEEAQAMQRDQQVRQQMGA